MVSRALAILHTCAYDAWAAYDRDAVGTRLGGVLRVLGEPLFSETDYCQRHAGTEAEGNCVHHGACTLRALWLTLEQWMRHSLDQITLADLMQTELSLAELLRTRLAAPARFEQSPPLLTLNRMPALEPVQS